MCSSRRPPGPAASGVASFTSTWLSSRGAALPSDGARGSAADRQLKGQRGERDGEEEQARGLSLGHGIYSSVYGASGPMKSSMLMAVIVPFRAGKSESLKSIIGPTVP